MFIPRVAGRNQHGRFRLAPESSVIYPSTRGRHLGSGFHRRDEYTAIGPIDAFDTRVDDSTVMEFSCATPKGHFDLTW